MILFKLISICPITAGSLNMLFTYIPLIGEWLTKMALTPVCSANVQLKLKLQF